MLDVEGFLWSVAFVTVSIGIPCLVGILIFGRMFGLRWEDAIGLIRLDLDLEDEIRRRVHARVSITKIQNLPRLAAQDEVEKAACQEIVQTFQDKHPEGKYKWKPGRWPIAICTLLDGEAIVTIWLGVDYSDDGNGVEPIRVATNWQLRPDARRNIRKVLSRAPAQADPLPIGAKGRAHARKTR